MVRSMSRSVRLRGSWSQSGKRKSVCIIVRNFRWVRGLGGHHWFWACKDSVDIYQIRLCAEEYRYSPRGATNEKLRMG